MKLTRNSKGFTLVEIMIVVAIIGLLAAIAVPNFVQARTQARTNTCINNLRLIQAAIDQWAIENNVAETATVTAANIQPYFKGNAIPAEPTGGSYTVTTVDAAPTCSVGGTHTL